MENTLITEINRIHTLMGVEKKLIKESVASIAGSLSYLWDDVLKKLTDEVASATPDRQSGNYVIKGKSYGGNQVSDLLRVVRGIDNKSVDSDNIKDILNDLNRGTQSVLAEIIKNTEGAADDMYEKLIKSIYNYPDSPFKSEQQVIMAINKMMEEENKNIDQVLSVIFGEDNYILQQVLKGKFTDNSKLLKKGEFVATVPPKSIQGGKILSDTEIAELNKIVTKDKATVFFRDLGKVMFQSSDETIKNIESLTNGFYESYREILKKGFAKERLDEEIKSLTNAYAVSFNREINALIARSKKDASTILREYNIPNEIIQKLENSKGDYFSAWREVHNGDQKLIANVRDTGAKFGNDLMEIFKGRFGSLLSWNNSFTQYLLTAQFDSWGAWVRRIVKMRGLSDKTSFLKFASATFVAMNIGILMGQVLMSTIVTGWWLSEPNLKKMYNFFAPEEYELQINTEGQVSDNVITNMIAVFSNDLFTRMDSLYGELGLGSVLKLLPGGIGTFQKSLVSLILGSLGRGDVPGLEEMIYRIFGLETSEVEKIEGEVGLPQEGEQVPQREPDGSPRETEPNTQEEFPQDLLDVVKDENEDKLIRDGDNIYWGSKDYPIKKTSNGVWRVYTNGSWYDINTDM